MKIWLGVAALLGVLASTLAQSVNFRGSTRIGSSTVEYSWTLTGVSGATFQCSLNGQAAQPCTSPYVVNQADLQSGPNTLEVTATFSGRTAGPLRLTATLSSTSTTPAAVSFTGRAESSGDSVVFTWSVTGVSGVTFQCSLNGGPSFACTSPHTVALSALQDGENVLSVTASGGGVTFPRPLELTVTRSSSSASYRTLSVNNGAYNVSWRVVGDVASFVLSARTTGWVGLGFSRNQQMANTDVVVGGADSNGAFVYDGFATAYARPPVDTQEDISNYSASHANGVTTVRFSRRLSTGDTQDYDLTEDLYWLFAYGGTFSGSNRASLGAHSVRGVIPGGRRSLMASTPTPPTTSPPSPSPSPTNLPTSPPTQPPVSAANFTGFRPVINGTSVVFTWSVTGVSGVTFQCSLNGGPLFACTSPHTVALSDLQDGENVLSVTASGGGVTFPRPLELKVTKSPPSVSVDLSATVEGQELAFSWTPASGAVYRCTLDGGEEFDCSSGYKLSFSDAGAGDHSLVVRAYVNGQLAGSGTATFTVPTPPLPSVSVDLTAAVMGQELAFSWTPASGAVYRCTLDGGEEFDCSSGYKLSFSEAGAGDHSLVVRAYVNGQLAGSGTATFTVPMQPLPPAPLDLAANRGGVNGDQLVITWTEVEGVTYKCSVNGGPQFACSSGHMVDLCSLCSFDKHNVTITSCRGETAGGSATATFSSLSQCGQCSYFDGAYSVNWTTSGELASFVLSARTTGWVGIGFSRDTNMADTDVVVGGSDDGGMFVFDGYADARRRPPVDSQEDISGFSTSHNNGETTVRFSRKVVTSDSDRDLPLNEDLYWLFAYGGTFSGSDPTSIGYHGSMRAVSSQTIRLPCSAPAVNIPLTAERKDGAIVFSWTAISGVEYLCSLDGQPDFACSSGHSVPLNGLAPGEHTFQVRVFGCGEVVGSATATFTATPGTTTPQPSGVKVTKSNDTFTITWDTDSTLTYRCFVNGKPTVVCSSPFTLQEDTLGAAATTVRVVSFRGNTQVGVVGESVVESCKFTGITPPDRAYLWPAGFVMFNWTAKGNVDFTRCKLDGGPEMPCESGLSYNVNDVTAGTHRVEVIAYCQGEPIGRETIGFRSQSGIPKDPTRCQRLSVADATAAYDSSAATVTVSFRTNVPSSCVCKLPPSQQIIRPCMSGSRFTSVPDLASTLHASRTRAKVAIFCKADDCGTKHMVPAYFNIR